MFVLHKHTNQDDEEKNKGNIVVFVQMFNSRQISVDRCRLRSCVTVIRVFRLTGAIPRVGLHERPLQYALLWPQWRTQKFFMGGWFRVIWWSSVFGVRCL